MIEFALENQSAQKQTSVAPEDSVVRGFLGGVEKAPGGRSVETGALQHPPQIWWVEPQSFIRTHEKRIPFFMGDSVWPTALVFDSDNSKTCARDQASNLKQSSFRLPVNGLAFS